MKQASNKKIKAKNCYSYGEEENEEVAGKGKESAAFPLAKVSSSKKKKYFFL